MKFTATAIVTVTLLGLFSPAKGKRKHKDVEYKIDDSNRADAGVYSDVIDGETDMHPIEHIYSGVEENESRSLRKRSKKKSKKGKSKSKKSKSKKSKGSKGPTLPLGGKSKTPPYPAIPYPVNDESDTLPLPSEDDFVSSVFKHPFSALSGLAILFAI
jgi:hypothetical protein